MSVGDGGLGAMTEEMMVGAREGSGGCAVVAGLSKVMCFPAVK